MATHDIVLFQPAWMADYSFHLEPLDKLAEEYGLDFQLDDIMPAYRDLYSSWGGTIYAVPFDGDQHNLYYNTVAFESEENKKAFEEEYGYELVPPQTWDQYRDIAEFFNGRDWDGDGEPEYGVAEAWQRGGYAFWWWANKFASYGGVFFDEDLNPLINSPAGVKALENTLAIVDFVPPGTANFGYPELEAALIKGTVPMVVQWSSTGKSAMDPDQSEIVGKVGTAVLPGVEVNGEIHRRPGLPTGWSAGIPKYAENKEAAAYVLAIISTQEHALEICLDAKTYVDPWRISSFDAPEWLELWPDYPELGQQYVDVMKETVATGVPDLQIPGSAEYIRTADREISEAIAGNKTAQEALDAAAVAWDEISERFGRDNQKAAWNTEYDAMKALGIEYKPEIAE
jgi:multiple sugar transport system substrate-binding protein